MQTITTTDFPGNVTFAVAPTATMTWTNEAQDMLDDLLDNDIENDIVERR